MKKNEDKTIALTIRFWTNDIADDEGKIEPKHCRDSGVVRLENNSIHGIKREQNPVPFNSMMQLMAAIEKELILQGIVLHDSRRTKKLRGD